MSTITINGARVAIASITIPMYGAWSADVTLPVDAPIAAGAREVTLAVGSLSLVGTVVSQAAFDGDVRARIVGGAAGWRKVLRARGYSHVAGVSASSVVADAARECGESIVLDTDRNLGVFFAREEGKARDTLSLVIGETWWVDNAGVTQTKARAATAIVTPFTVVSRAAERGAFEIATEDLASWVPGRTFQHPTIPTAQTISSVTITSGNEGKLRLTVLATDGADVERLRGALRALVRAELSSLLYAGTWEYTVAPSTGLPGTDNTIDCTPTDSRMPSLTRVPLHGLGIVSVPLAGTPCRIRFVNCDPSRPECLAVGGTTEHLATVEGTALLIYNTLVALMAAAGGGPLLAAVLQPLLGAAVVSAITAQSAPAPPGSIAQAAAAAAQLPGFLTGAAPATTSAFFTAAIAALSTKTLDVTGQFPSIGVPNGD